MMSGPEVFMQRSVPSRSFSLDAFRLFPILVLLVSFLPVAAALPAAAEQNPAGQHPACRPTPETEALLAELDPIALPGCSEDQDCLRAEIEENRRVVAEQAGNVHLQRNLQSLVSWYHGDDQDELQEQLAAYYARRAEEHPDDPTALYLHGWRREGAEGDRIVRQALAKDPDFPWSHLALAQRLSRTDRSQALEHLRRYLRLCPEATVESLQAIPMLPEAEIWKPRLDAMRKDLRSETFRRQLRGFPRFWILEFQIAPPAEHAEIRKRVLADVEILERRNQPDVSYWWAVLYQGYESAGNAEALARFEERVIETRPCDPQAVDARFRGLERQNLAPGPEDELEPEVLRRVWELSRQWIRQCPDEMRFSVMHFENAMRLGTLSDEEILAEVERHVKVWDKGKYGWRMSTTPWGRAAGELLDRGLAPQRAVELAEKEVARAEAALEERVRRGERQTGGDSETQAPWAAYLRAGHSRVAVQNALLARARFAAGQTERAREAIAAGEEALIEVRAFETTYPEELYPPRHDLSAGSLVAVLAEHAEREERLADALALYHRAAKLRPDDEELQERPREVWSALGGTDEGWEALTRQDEIRVVGQTAAASTEDEEGRWQSRDEPLPDFALSDLQGKTWTPKHFEGKTVLINLWATWCGPCRLELPYLHELQQQIAEREDLALVTLNADYNPGLIQPFLDKNGYRFPVLLAETFLQEEYGGAALPQTWIVDSAGVVRFRQRGFPMAHKDTWVDEALEHMESVAGSRDPGAEATDGSDRTDDAAEAGESSE